MARLSHAPHTRSEHRASARDADELKPRVSARAPAETRLTSRSPTRASDYPRRRSHGVIVALLVKPCAELIVQSYPLTWPGAGDDESRERFAEVRKAAGETHKAVHDANKSLAQLKALHGALSPLISLTNTTAREKLADIPSEITRTHELGQCTCACGCSNITNATVDKLASVGKGRRAGEEGYEPSKQNNVLAICS